MAEGWPKQRRLLGTKVKRIDGPEKSTGRAKYSYDINRPGLLHAVMLRSPHAHARIKSIDTTAAKKTPGFKALVMILPATNWIVVKAEGDSLELKSVPGKKKTDKEVMRTVRVTPGVTIIRRNKVVKLADLKVDDQVQVENEQDAVGRELYYAGDEIAAVAADTEEHAKDALRAIKVEYEILDHMVVEEDVLKDRKKKTTPGPLPANFDDSIKDATRGDPDAGFKDAEVVHEGTYGVPVISHQCLESHGLVAEWDADGNGLTVWASTQAVSSVAAALAGRFGIPPSKVKCVTHFMGGGFGSKFSPGVPGFAAVDLARRAGAPVKFMLDREEEITTAGNRPSASGTVKIGGKKDGTITAFAVDCYGTSGFGGGATINLNLMPYVYSDVVANMKRSHKVLYTNAGLAQAMRAPGHPQNCVLTEFALDDLAAKLGIDPLVIRRKNLPPNNPKADKITWAGRRNDIYNEQLDIALKLSGWKEKWHPPGKGKAGTWKHGIGMAIHTWGGFAAGGTTPNECHVTISKDGTATAQTSTQDLGTAQRTVTAIVTAEILGLQVADMVVKIGESLYGFSSGSGGSTTCPSQAPATLLAAQAARDDLFKKVGPKIGADPKDLAIGVGKVVDKKNNKEWAWKEFCARLGMDEAKGKGEWSLAISNEAGNENISSGQVGGLQTAEVLVDSETGVVRVTHMVAVQDCGLLINKLACESQVAGGVIMGLNYALFEENILDKHTGRQVNPDMEFYKLGGIRDMPKITVHMQDMPDRGVIGIGEPPTISTAAAIGNAVFNALGVRVPFLPIIPRRVLDALAKGGAK